MHINRGITFGRPAISGVVCALFLAIGSPAAHAQDTAPDTAPAPPPETASQTGPVAPECKRTTLSHAIELVRKAIDATHAKDTDPDENDAPQADDTGDGDANTHMVAVLSAELAITAVPRYYDIILFDEDRNYFARVDEATNRVLNLTRPGENRNEKISREAEPLKKTAHQPIEAIIAGAQESRPRGIPTSARLSHVYGPQPVYEVVMRMPPGNDEVLLVDGLSGQTIELENFQ